MRFYIRKADADSVKVYYDIGISKDVKLRGVTDQYVNPAWNDFRVDKKTGKILVKNRKRVRQSTIDIDTIKKRASGNEEKDKAIAVRGALEKFENEIGDKLKELKEKYDDDLSIKDELQDEINSIYNKNENQSKKMSLLQYIDYHIKNLSKKKITKNGVSSPIGSTTLNRFDNLKQRLIEYKEKESASLKYSDINMTWHTNFQDFLENEKDLEYNTIGNYTAGLKSVLDHAFIDDQHSNKKYNKFKVLRIQKKKDYLNEKELRDFEAKEYKGKDLMCRDYFLLMSYTGMRSTEILSLTEENIITHKGIKMISFYEPKNAKDRIFLITDDVQRVLDRWSGFPNDGKHRKDQVKYRTILKFLSKAIPDKKITLHTGRRNFSTNEYLKGTSVEDIMIQTGHKTYSIFMNYIQATGKDILAERQLNKMKKQ